MCVAQAPLTDLLASSTVRLRLQPCRGAPATVEWEPPRPGSRASSTLEHDRISVAILDLFDLSGRVAIVTGASRGIGAEISRALDSAGARVVLVARDEVAMADVAASLSNDPLMFQADLVAANAASDVVEFVRSTAGRIDILVNNAGVAPLSPAIDVRVDEWDAILDLNLRAPFLLAREAAKAMVPAGGGKIVNVSSAIALASDAWTAPYSASKSGMLGLTRALAVEWARRNIQVNTLCPGWIETAMTDAMRKMPDLEERVMRAVPQRRWGQPRDLSGAILFLCSSASDFVTGQTLTVDGGLTARW